MTVTAARGSGIELTAADLDRLAALGFSVADAGDGRAVGSMWTVVDRPSIDDVAGDQVVAVQLIPARTTPSAGPVAVLSPAGAAAHYELHVGAALAAASRRRVIHLNGRGTAASIHSGAPARAAARAGVTDWYEQAHPHPERTLHTLDSRPSVIVVPAVGGAGELTRLAAAHHDADIVVVHDRVADNHGGALARQIFAMVELALGVSSAAAAPAATPPPRPPSLDPAIRASDVLHVRLTDTGVEVTNRTAQHIGVRLGIGDGRSPDAVLATLENHLPPGDSRATLLDGAPALDGLARPAAVLRHWSHGSAEVYEGGDLRVLRIQLVLGGPDDEPGQPREFSVGNGLDFSLTARELRSLDRTAPQPQVLPAPAPAAPPAPSHDLLEALSAAAAVAAGALSSARTAPGS